MSSVVKQQPSNSNNMASKLVSVSCCVSWAGNSNLISFQILAALCFFAFAAMVAARPRFLAIPLEDIQFIQGPAYLPRVRRAGT